MAVNGGLLRKFGNWGGRLGGLAKPAKAALCAVIVNAFGVAASVAAEPADYRLLKLDGRLVKWGEPRLGAAASVTYAYANQRIDTPGARNCRTIEPAETLIARLGVDATTFDELVAQAFGHWSAAANLEFTRIADASAADIVIGADGAANGWAFADVAAARSDEAIGSIDRALVCLNAGRSWKIGFGGPAGAQDFRYTLTHEIGHALGLNHSGPHGQLMSYAYAETFEGPQAGDISGAQTLYGAPRAPRPIARVRAGAPSAGPAS